MIEHIAQKAKKASITMASLDTAMKNKALRNIAKSLWNSREKILQANQLDMDQAQKENLSQVLLKRLKFDETKLKTVIEGINQLIKLEDPIGKTLCGTELDNQLELYKVTCPIGVLGIIFESRPDALVQISTLALKSGNTVLLKGGSEAIKTNRILAETIYLASIDSDLPQHWLNLLETREDIKHILALDEYIDLIIPRGSNEFVKYIMDNTRIMVLGHADGICHVYIDGLADIEKAINIAYDSKCQYPAVCNAMETLLVEKAIAAQFLPRIKEKYDTAGVELFGDSATSEYINVKAATEQDWRTEYNDLALSIKVVDNLDEAIEHINTYGSGHTDTIVTENKTNAQSFMDRIDSAGVFWNASTRFADGFRYGLGAEVGISTNKIHARGPVGLEGLIIYKWKLIGNGHIVADYSDNKSKSLTSKAINNTLPL